ncbi:type IV secretory system conjugative DNA transfer family protein [Ensifer adhaerens]|uniref:type IV secretory system conjugative DNA transfer family protein n=1 Tax=Ensifer adhaerens TaxID=106592 RepID=UPI003D07CCC0
MAKSAVFLGYHQNYSDNKWYETRLNGDGRELHTYVVGASGSGKTELLKILMHHDIHHTNAALVVIDAHTDVCDQVARWPGDDMHKRLVYLAPELYPDTLPTLNPFQLPKGATSRTKEKVANRLGELIGDICRGGGGADLSVRMVNVAKACIRVLIDVPGATLKDLRDMMGAEPSAALLKAAANHAEPMVREFFRTEWETSDYTASKAAIRVRLTNLLLHRDFLHITCNPNSTPLYDLVDQGKIILFSLGRAGSETAQIVGKMVISMMAVLGDMRKDTDRSDRRPVHIFVDECQNFMGPAVITILTELRKYGVRLTLANQYITAFSRDQQSAVLTNCQAKVLGTGDAPGPMLAAMQCDPEDAQGLPQRHFLVKWGSADVLTVQTRSDLADEKVRCTPSQWIARKLSQKRFYASSDDMATTTLENAPSAVVEGFTRELD